MSDNSLTISSLKAKLAPPSDAELSRLVSVLLAQWPNVRAGEIDLRVDGYMLALRGYGETTIKTCITAAIRGEIGKPEFLPLAPELSAWCRAYERFDRDAMARELQIEDQRGEVDRWQRLNRSPRVAEGLDKLARTLAAGLPVTDDLKIRTAQKE